MKVFATVVQSRGLRGSTASGMLAASLLAAAVHAQDARTTQPAQSDDLVTLSPFVINAERDTGFVPASSLAGGRLAGDLKDTPVAYSVVTRDFIDALGITNISDAANWTPNSVTYVASNGGGYGDDASSSPGSFNVRGAGGGRGQRNFFNYYAPNDSYAAERFDMGRGPNAILFGNGGLGGVATTTTKQAKVNRTFGELSQLVGSWDTYRTTIDYNRGYKDKFAVRLAGVYGDAGGWRLKQFDKIKAGFLTTTFNLGKNTTVRAEGEYGEVARNQTFTNLTDRLSGWDGKTTFSGVATTLPSNANAIGVTRRNVGYNVYDPYSGLKDTVMSYQWDPITMGGGQSTGTPVAGYLPVPGSPGFGTDNATILYARNVPENRFANAIAGSEYRMPSRSFSLASDWPVLTERFRDLQVTVDHRIRNVYFQFAADANRTDQRTYTMDVRGNNQMFIDINRVLPNGAPNPHFLQPYADANLRRNVNYRDADAWRFAVGSFKDAGKWGYYTFNVMGGSSTNTYGNKALNLSLAQNADHRRWGSSGNELTETDRIRIRRYWNEPYRPFTAPSTMTYIDPINRIEKTVTPIWAVENDRADSSQDTKSRYDYLITAFNAKFFRNKLVVLGALRADKYHSVNFQQIKAGDYDPDNWNGLTAIFKPEAPEDYATLMYTPKDTAGKPTGPAVSADARPRDGNGNRLAQYAGDRFKDDYNAPAVDKSNVTKSVGAVWHMTNWVSPYVNYAETYNPPGYIQLLDSSFPPATVAKGIDVGLRFSLLKSRLNLTVLYYTNKELNNSVGASLNGTINGLLACNALGDTSTAGRNKRGVGNLPAIANDLRDREADGFELEAVANMSKQWRLMFNVGLPKVYEDNAYRLTRKYLDENWDMLKQIALDAGVRIDANNVASVDTSIPVNERSPDVNTAVNNYNSLVQNRNNLITNKRIVQDQPSFNIFTDYTIGSGRLKGLRIGIGTQWRGKQIAAYQANDTIVDPANPTRAIDDPDRSAYTALYTPNTYHNEVLTLGYSMRLASQKELRFDVRVNNLLNRQGAIYSSGSTALRPRNGDYTSPARETVCGNFAYQEPLSIKFTTTLKF